MFVDRVQIKLQAGKGGDGCRSFRRERYVPRGGPDGGDGGHGGSIVIEAREGLDHLSALAHRKAWKAERGKHGSGGNRQGGKGADITLLVPPGTVVIDAGEGFVIRDLTAAGDSFEQGGRAAALIPARPATPVTPVPVQPVVVSADTVARVEQTLSLCAGVDDRPRWALQWQYPGDATPCSP